MQNIPLPNQAAILNNTAASAAAAKSAKQPSGAKEGADFKQVLAKQVKQETREAANTEALAQKQRLQLQIKVGEETPLVDAAGLARLAPELPLDEPMVQDDDALLLAESENEVGTILLTEAEAQPSIVTLTPDVQRARPMGVEPDVVEESGNLQRGEPLPWSAKGNQWMEGDDAQDGAAIELAQTTLPKIASSTESTGQFADALEQIQTSPLANVATQQVAQPQLLQQAAAMDGRHYQVATAFGQPGWNQAIGQRVVWMVAGGEQMASLTLNPPDLGPVQVIIHVHNNQADTTFLSDQADVRRALEDGMDNLRQMMNQSGLQLGQANVRSGQQDAQQQPGGGTRSTQAGEQIDEVNPVLAKAARVMGLVDTFA